MEHKQISNCDLLYDRLPPLSTKYPWFVAQNLEDEDCIGDQIFYTLHEPQLHYRCRIPELSGRSIPACFHGWVVLSNHPHDIMWFLWNPLTSKLNHKLQDTHQCCLSSPPDDPSSVFLLTTEEKPTIIFCRLDRKRKKLRWTEMSYAKQYWSMSGGEDGILVNLTCFNGKVYAHTRGLYYRFLIQIDIVVKDKEVVISLLPIVELPCPSLYRCPSFGSSYTRCVYMKGSCRELFYIEIGIEDKTTRKVGDVYLFTLDMTSMMWKEMEDLKNAIIFVHVGQDDSVFYSPLGGYIHLIDRIGKVHSYNVKDRTISISSMPSHLEGTRTSPWPSLEYGLEGDPKEAECIVDSRQGDNDAEIIVKSITGDETEFSSTKDESYTLNIPFHVLETIMEFCVGVEYLKFRATCKLCHLAAPTIQGSNKSALSRLQAYSLNVTWFMVLDKHRGIITFTDPMFDDKYFIKIPQELIDFQIHCSRYGWVLMFKAGRSMVFFNPITSDIREFIQPPGLESCCFSAPPTSRDCMVVGFINTLEWQVFIHFVSREPYGRTFHVYGGADFCFPTYYGGDLYALSNEGETNVFEELGEEGHSWDHVVAKPPTICCGSSARYFLGKCHQHLLIVIVGEFGESVEVFKHNDSTKQWEKIDGLGKHMIYICDTSCLCIEAKIPEMENKIYFPRLHPDSGKIVFYSLETCMYHTFDGKIIEKSFGNLLQTKHHRIPHTWIEPLVLTNLIASRFLQLTP